MTIRDRIAAALAAAATGRRRWYLLGALALLGLGWIWLGGGEKAGAETYITAALERGPIRNTVSATGTVQAVLTVQVGSQVTGRIADLHADFNSVVKAGQVLARIDPANFDAQLDRARADLTDARAGVRTADAAVATQKANLEASKVAAADALRAYKRARELSEEEIVSTRDLEVAEAAYEQAKARVEQGAAQVRSAEAALEQARARVDQARAAVKMAEVNLFYTVITSPVDGVVISRSVDVGQTVSASLQAPTIFTIANDLTKMQVVANVDEADIGSITPEARVGFTVDAFPGEVFTGSLNQIRLNPQTQQNVVTYSVIVDVPNPSLKLRPGMTANTTFTIAEREDALRLPNSALRFWPEGIPREKEREMIAEAAGKDPSAAPGERAEVDVPRAAAPGGGAFAAGANHEGARPGRGAGEGPHGGSDAAGPPRRDAEPVTARPAGGAAAPPEALSGATSPLPQAGEVIRFPSGRRTGSRPRVIWVLDAEGRPQPRVVTIGISDGTASEVVEGDVKAGTPVVIGRNVTAEMMRAAGRSPFGMPGMGRPGGGRPPARTGR